MGEPRYSAEPDDPVRFTREWDRKYTAFARLYDVAVRRLPVWRSWIERALPHIEGARVLEVSFGTGHLLTRCAGRFETHGIDYNRAMVQTARQNLRRAGATAALVRGSVEQLPYRDGWFDSLVNTMAFSGYPDGRKALGEMKRVLRDGGKLVLVDFTFPADRNPLGILIAKLWQSSGDVIRDMAQLLGELGFEFKEEAIGGWRSVHLYVATKPASVGERDARSDAGRAKPAPRSGVESRG